MTAEPDAIRYRRIRAPREDGQALVDPPFSIALEHLASVSSRGDGGDAALADDTYCGKSFAELSQLARSEVTRLAADYTARYRDVSFSSALDDPSQPMVLAGHQPTLFHPGVWFKNFALSTLAEQGAATAINLVVDNDTIRSASIRVPTGSADAPLFENVAFDRPTAELPFEERRLHDAEFFDSFADRVQAVFTPLLPRSSGTPYTPLVERLWDIAREVRRRRDPATSIGWLLAEARHQLEGNLGLRTLELPLSIACDTAAFRWFTVYLLSEMPRLAQAYNQLLAEYRIINHVRSRSHPVPDLARHDDWLEAPFWIWTTDNPRRRHLFVRRRPGVIEISDLANLKESLPFEEDRDATSAIEAISQLRALGIKIRPRALVTTMFSRLLAGDLFLHGIGGAKYDELTDAIIGRFFRLAPPLFLTVTATFQLPIARPQLSLEDLRRHQRKWRETIYHPEQFATQIPQGTDARFQQLATRKQLLLQELQQRREQGGALKSWHAELAATNQAMADLLSEHRARLAEEQPKLNERLLAAQRLGSREFSFVLFPEETLPEQLKQLSVTEQA